MPAGSPSIYATASVNGMFFLSIMLLFEYYRNKIVDIYAPRSRGKFPKSVKPKEGFLQWFPQIYNIEEDEMFVIAGMDGYVLLRFVKFCGKVGAVTSILAGSVLLPVYYTAPGKKEAYGIDVFSMANIEQNGSRLWASLIFAYLFTLIFLYLIHLEYEHFVYARKKFFDGQDEVIPVQVHYTVQVENIPAEYRNSQRLYEVFEEIFPNEVLFAHVAVSTPRLDATINKLHTARAQLETAIAAYEASHRQTRPILYLRRLKRSLLNADKEVDAIIYLTGRVERLAARVARLQVESCKEPTAYLEDDGLHGDGMQDTISDIGDNESLRGSFSSSITDDDTLLLNATGFSLHSGGAGTEDDSGIVESCKRRLVALFHDVKDRIVANFVSATGFVTFRTRRAQASAVRMPILLDRYPTMIAHPAPAPNDVIWSNMSAPQRHTDDVAYFTSAAYYCGLFFWSLVMAFIAALSNVSTFENYIPSMQAMNPYVYAVLQGILPVVVMLCFSYLLVSTMRFISMELERRKTHSAVDQEVFKWYFMYQIANIYLLLFAGSIWDSLAEAIENPRAILSLISAALPRVSIFFINYIITILLSAVPYKMIRRFCAIQYLYYRCCTSDAALTRRMLKCPEGPFGETRVSYGTEFSDILYVLCVVMLYWVIAPFVLILATALFWAWYFMWKYQYVFVITRTFESGGLFWYKLYRYSMTGLMGGTITFMAYMGIKEGVSQGPLLVPLPIIIYIAWQYTDKRFRNLSENLAFGTALKQEHHSSSEDLHGMLHPSTSSSSLSTVNSVGPAPSQRQDQQEVALLSAVDSADDPESAHLHLAAQQHQLALRHQRHLQEHQHQRHQRGGSFASHQSVSVLSKFRENFMKQPNLLCPSRIYPYPYRLYNTPLLDRYGSLNEIYLEGIPEGVDPATLFPDTAIPSYGGSVAAGARGAGGEEDGSGASATADLLAPLSLSYAAESEGRAASAGSGVHSRSARAGMTRSTEASAAEERDSLLQL